MFNLAILEGRLTEMPEEKTTQSGIPVTSFSIAVDRPYQKDKETETDFINIVAWRSTAQFICRNFVKGNRIGIEGAIQMRRYEDKNGNRRVTYEVVASNVHLIDYKRNDTEPSAPAETAPAANTTAIGTGDDDDLPF